MSRPQSLRMTVTCSKCQSKVPGCKIVCLIPEDRGVWQQLERRATIIHIREVLKCFFFAIAGFWLVSVYIFFPVLPISEEQITWDWRAILRLSAGIFSILTYATIYMTAHKYWQPIDQAKKKILLLYGVKEGERYQIQGE